MADLDADGKVELLQTFIDNTGNLSALSHNQSGTGALRHYTTAGGGVLYLPIVGG